MTHTPGPWQGGLQISSSKGSNIIAHIQTRTKKLSGYSNANGVYHYEALANAQLIAAAPDLLEALKESLVILEASYLDWAETPYESQNSNGDVIFEVKERVKEVIAKAIGEEP